MKLFEEQKYLMLPKTSSAINMRYLNFKQQHWVPFNIRCHEWFAWFAVSNLGLMQSGHVKIYDSLAVLVSESVVQTMPYSVC